METYVLREKLKTGVLGGLYSSLRRIKRRLRNEPVAGDVPLVFPSLTAEEIRGIVGETPAHARLYFSLALMALENESAGESDLRRAEACLRCAKTLDFESEERIALYRGLIAAKWGETERAKAFVAELEPYELTEPERAICEQILTGTVPVVAGDPAGETAARWQSALQTLIENYSDASSLLFVGDEAAHSANTLPDADYLLVAPNVTGLTLEGVASLNKEFAVGIGNAQAQPEAERLKVSCGFWISVES